MTRHSAAARRGYVALGLLGLTLVLLIAFAIVGCGSETPESSNTTQTTSALETTLPPPGLAQTLLGAERRSSSRMESWTRPSS